MDPLVVVILIVLSGTFLRMAMRLLVAAFIVSGLIAFGLGACATLAALMAAGIIRF